MFDLGMAVWHLQNLEHYTAWWLGDNKRCRPSSLHGMLWMMHWISYFKVPIMKMVVIMVSDTVCCYVEHIFWIIEITLFHGLCHSLGHGMHTAMWACTGIMNRRSISLRSLCRILVRSPVFISSSWEMLDSNWMWSSEVMVLRSSFLIWFYHFNVPWYHGSIISLKSSKKAPLNWSHNIRGTVPGGFKEAYNKNLENQTWW